MEQIHNKLLQSSQTYAKWHAHPKHRHVHWGTVIIVALFLTFLLIGGIKNWRSTLYDFVTIDFRPRSSVLTLDPQEKEIKVGETFAINILLDTKGEPVDGVDIYSLHYDPTILSVVDDSSGKSGVQITPGEIMPLNMTNSVDPKTGTIKFSAGAAGGTNYTGNGALATIHFKGVAKGSTYLKFDFKLGNTRDTNAAYGGRDQLANVVDGLYTVK